MDNALMIDMHATLKAFPAAAGRSLAILALLAASMAMPAATPARTRAGEALTPFGVRDLVNLERISEIAVSPDGKVAAFTLRTTDVDADKGHTAVWLMQTRKRNAQPARLSDFMANSSAAEWSADGRFVYYLSNRGGSTQVWRTAVNSAGQATSEPLQITHLPLDVGSFRVSAKGDKLVASLWVFIDCADLDCTKQRLGATASLAARGRVYDKLFVRHWDAWSDGRRSQLFSLALDAAGIADGTPVNLTAGIDGDVPGTPFGGREFYDISPDGTQVAYSVRRGERGEAWSTNFDIYLVGTAGGEPRNLTADNQAWDARPAFSPSGSTLAYLAMDRPGYEADRFHLMLLDLRSLRSRPLTQSWDRSIDSFAWSKDGKTLFATADHLGQHPLWSIDAATGRAAAITGEGHVEGFAVGADRIFFASSDLAHPGNLYAVNPGGGKPAQLTRLNQDELAKRALGDYEQFSFAGSGEDNVFGYLVKPAGFKAGVKYPVAFVIHGGPQSSMANIWHWRWNAQALAGAGYGVLMIDFHGSTGYGQAFTDAIRDDWGGKPLEDLKRGMDAALKRYPWLDGERACALGGSYGGYMINWIASQWPDRFRCLVSHDGIFDNRTMYYSTEELWFPEWEFGGPQFQNPEDYSRQNPMDHVAQWKTPTLVVHGQLDYRVPYEQGLAAFTALQRRGIPSEMLYFPDENHWVLKPSNSIQWYDTVIGWLNRWTHE